MVHLRRRRKRVSTTGGLRHRSCCRFSRDSQPTSTSASCHSRCSGCPKWVVSLRRASIHERTDVRRTRNPSRCPSRRSTAFASAFMTNGQVVERPDSDLLAMITEPSETPACPGHGHPGRRESSWLQRRVHCAIVFYQRAREGRPSPCRFFPSCSAYALEAVEVHGTGRGGWLSLRRLLRCRPLGPSGVDLVPAGPSSTVSCQSHGADAPALLIPTVVSSTPKKGG